MLSKSLNSIDTLFKLKKVLSSNYNEIKNILQNIPEYSLSEKFIRFSQYIWFTSNIDLKSFSKNENYLSPIFITKIKYFDLKLNENLSPDMHNKLEKNYLIELSMNNLLIKTSQAKLNIDSSFKFKCLSCNDKYHYRDIYGNIGTRMICTHPSFFIIFYNTKNIYIDAYTLRYVSTETNIKSKLDLSNIKSVILDKSPIQQPSLTLKYYDNSQNDTIIINKVLISTLSTILKEKLIEF